MKFKLYFLWLNVSFFIDDIVFILCSVEIVYVFNQLDELMIESETHYVHNVWYIHKQDSMIYITIPNIELKIWRTLKDYLQMLF